MRLLRLASLSVVTALAASCDCGASVGGGRDGDDTDGGPDVVCAEDCPASQRCVLGQCVPDQPCSESGDCQDDSYCDDDDRCVPFGLPGGRTTDDACVRDAAPGRFRPAIQCEWLGPPAGDPHPESVHILSTPMVVDFGFRDDPDGFSPSIVFVTDDGLDGDSEQPTGVVRVIDGATCAHQYTIEAHRVSHSSSPALADLDGDERPEIVAFASDGGLVAFRYDAGTDAFVLLWHSTERDGVTPNNMSGGGYAGPSIHDLDDDGVPEVLRGGAIFDARGVLRGDSLGIVPYSVGIFPVVADVDLDGAPELVTGAAIYAYDLAAQDWTPEPYVAEAQPEGHTAVADFGAFPLTAMDLPDAPEVVVISNGSARVQTIEGTVVFGPYPIPGGGVGGAPTIADFDGDGRAEFATAGLANYVVYDLDCVDQPDGVGTCGTGGTGGILWAQPSQDASSNVTGSSVFDFEGDGAAEAVYADECFVRVYAGATGEVVYSQYRSSCTWYENPIVADTDGDFNAELVVPSNLNCSPDECPTCGVTCSLNVDGDLVDQLFAGLRCAVDEDCPTAASHCDAGYCRCASDDECCAQGACADRGSRCAPPPAGLAGTGNTCRARHPAGTAGLRVYADAADRWVGSRRIWNQHAYAVTNVEENGTVPASSLVANNWLTPGLNNFRANVQGELDALAAPDLTVSGRFACEPSGAITLVARLCNRGTQPVGAGATVAMRDGATTVCTASAPGLIEAGQCQEVSCEWPSDASPPYVDPRPVSIVADPDAQMLECHEGNNLGTIEDVLCATIQ